MSTTTAHNPLENVKSGYCPACDQEQPLCGVLPASPEHPESLALDCGHAVPFPPTAPAYLRAKASGARCLYTNKADMLRVQRREGKGCIVWAVADPVVGGARIADCDVLLWEQVTACANRCHEGLLQTFVKGQWVTHGRLLAAADSWEEMRQRLEQTPSLVPPGAKVFIAPAVLNEGAR